MCTSYLSNRLFLMLCDSQYSVTYSADDRKEEFFLNSDWLIEEKLHYACQLHFAWPRYSKTKPVLVLHYCCIPILSAFSIPHIIQNSVTSLS